MKESKNSYFACKGQTSCIDFIESVFKNKNSAVNNIGILELAPSQ